MRRPPLALAAMAAAVSFAAPAGPARADTANRVVIFPFEGFDLPAAYEKEPLQLNAVVELRFRTAAWDIVASTLMLRDMTVAVGCTAMDTACARALAEHFKADALVIGKLVAKDGKVSAAVRRYAHDGSLVTELSEPLPTASAERPAAYARLAEIVVTGKAPAPAAGADPAGPVTVPATRPAAGGGTVPPDRGVRLPVVPVGVAGLVLLAAAVPTAALTAKANHDFRASPRKSLADLDAAERIVKRGRLFAGLTDGLLAGGGAVLAAAVVMALVDGHPFGGGGGAAGDHDARPAPAVSFAPLPGGALFIVGVPWN
jgi:hypothetical protein